MPGISIMKNLIIVTGGAGFVGSNLIELLLKKTNYKIVSLDNYSSGSKKNHINHKRVNYIKGDTLKIDKILNKYKKNKQLSAEFIGRGGAWLDTGTIDDFYKTSNFVSAIENQQGFKIACLEEISLKNNWIKKKSILEAIKFYGNCEYSKYLKKIIS